jgi:Zn-dependent M28 family amino/carboxypeptidase
MNPIPSGWPDRARLERDVRRLAVIRHPSVAKAALRDAEDFVALELDAAGLRVERQLFRWQGEEYHNVLGTLDGEDPSRPWVVVGAHFDSQVYTPGADDNASGVAALLEIARLVGDRRFPATIQLVGFNLEEMQAGLRYAIGSAAYVRWLHERGVRLGGALVLEMLGFTGPRQTVPAAVRLVKRVPRVGNFLAAVGNFGAGRLLRAMERAGDGLLQVVTLSVPLKGWVVPDTRRSDNCRFWDAGHPALMVTDTAELRSPHYHQPSDTPETLDFAFLAGATEVVGRAVMELAG